MQLQLKSDYLDCYDHWFEREGDVLFSRVAEGSWGLSRARMFEIFSELGLSHPKFGRVDLFQPSEKIVVYLDEFAHQGEGKVLLTAQEAKERGFSQKIASLYIEDVKSTSWRLLAAGGLRSLFRVISFEDWRSNCGDGDILAALGNEIFPDGVIFSKILNPIWAIDFVGKPTKDGMRLLAVDFNTAPKIVGTPLAKEVSQKDIFSALETASKNYLTQFAELPTILHRGRTLKHLDNNIVLLGSG